MLSRKALGVKLLSLVLVVFMLLLAVGMTGCDGKGRPKLPNGGDDVTDVSDDDGSDINDDVVEVDPLAAIIAALPDPAAMDSIFDLLEGFWIKKKDNCVYFTVLNGNKSFGELYWESEYFDYGTITNYIVTGEYEFTLVVSYPKKSGSKAHTDEILFDLSDFNANHLIKVKGKKVTDNKWKTYSYGADEMNAAYAVWKKLH